jgi:hypothetical protein
MLSAFVLQPAFASGFFPRVFKKISGERGFRRFLILGALIAIPYLHLP